MKPVYFLVCLIGLLSGCQKNMQIKERQFDSPEFQRRAEIEALTLVNCEKIRYELFKTRYFPRRWVIHYELRDGQEAEVVLDLFGNLTNILNLPEPSNLCYKNVRNKEISRREAMTIASQYVKNIADEVILTYVHYVMAMWKVDVKLKEEEIRPGDWRQIRDAYISVTMYENGFLFYPEWLTDGNNRKSGESLGLME